MKTQVRRMTTCRLLQPREKWEQLEHSDNVSLDGFLLADSCIATLEEATHIAIIQDVCPIQIEEHCESEDDGEIHQPSSASGGSQLHAASTKISFCVWIDWKRECVMAVQSSILIFKIKQAWSSALLLLARFLFVSATARLFCESLRTHYSHITVELCVSVNIVINERNCT